MCLAIYNRTRSRGEQFARNFHVPANYDDPEELLRREKPDFVDIVTYPFTLSHFVKMAAAHKIPVISQKPMAPSVAIAEENIRACREAGVPYFIHENWRWQPQLRALKKALDSGIIGTPFRARISLVSAFPVYINEPQLKNLEEFILTDTGTHILDIARFYFGLRRRACTARIHRVHSDVKWGGRGNGHDEDGGARHRDACELGYPENYMEHEYFPETMIFVEGDRGTAEIAKDYWLRVTTQSGTHARRYPPVHGMPGSTPGYHVIHSSIVPTNANLLQALRGEAAARDDRRGQCEDLEAGFCRLRLRPQWKCRVPGRDWT